MNTERDIHTFTSKRERVLLCNIVILLNDDVHNMNGDHPIDDHLWNVNLPPESHSHRWMFSLRTEMFFSLLNKFVRWNAPTRPVTAIEQPSNDNYFISQIELSNIRNRFPINSFEMIEADISRKCFSCFIENNTNNKNRPDQAFIFDRIMLSNINRVVNVMIISMIHFGVVLE